jgi:hypothetical protein
MSTETEVRAAFAAGTASAPTQEALDKFAADMRAKGIDPSRTLAKHAPQQPSRAQLGAQHELTDTSNPRFSSDQLQQAGENLARYWSGPPEQLREVLARSGITLPDTNAPDTRSPEQIALNTSSPGAPLDPNEYDLRDVFVSREGLSSSELPALAGNIREALSGLSVPRALGKAVAGDFLDAAADAKWLQDQPEAVQQSYILEQRAMVARVLNVGYPEVIAAIKPYVDRLSPASKAWLGSSGAVNKATTLIRLYQTATLRNERSRMGGKS